MDNRGGKMINLCFDIAVLLIMALVIFFYETKLSNLKKEHSNMLERLAYDAEFKKETNDYLIRKLKKEIAESKETM